VNDFDRLRPFSRQRTSHLPVSRRRFKQHLPQSP
jgi:hypothetical protein